MKSKENTGISLGQVKTVHPDMYLGLALRAHSFSLFNQPKDIYMQLDHKILESN